MPVHLDDRAAGAQGQSEGHPGLGRPREARRRRDHAEPEDLRRRALELPRRLGLRARQVGTATRRRRASCSPASTRTRRCWTPARAARRTTFVERGIGDVLIAWENEALLARRDARRRASTRSSCPSVSILAEPPVAVVDTVVRRKGTTRSRGGVPPVPLHARGAGSDRASTTTARAIRRSPRSTRRSSRSVKLFTIDEKFGGWKDAQTRFFAEGGIFDQIYQPGTLSAHGAALRKPIGAAGLRAHARLHARVPEPAGADPARGAVLRSRRRSRGAEFLAAVALAARARGVPALVRRGVRRGAASTRSSAWSSRGCWSATASRAAASSTRSSTCPSRCRPRSPGITLTTLLAKNGWIGALLEPLGIQVAYTPLGVTSRSSSSACRSWCAPCSRCSQDLEPELEEAAASLGANRFADLPPRALPGAVAGAGHRLRARLRARARRVRLGRLHLGQHADEDRDRAAADRHPARAVRLRGRDRDRGGAAGALVRAAARHQRAAALRHAAPRRRRRTTA